MNFTRRDFLALASAGTLAGLSACSQTATSDQTEQGTDGDGDTTTSNVDLNEFKDLELDSGSWKYDSDNDVYYQLGLTYCKSPASETLESLAIFVPGGYFTAEQSHDSYSCTVNADATIGSFTSSTAPIVLAINTGNLSPQSCPTSYSYSGLADYMSAGCIYVYPGFRGRSSGYESGSSSDEVFSGGAPWPVVDLKAAIRYLRYNKDKLPCDTSRVFAMGFSEGGGVSALLGATGDAESYTPYLESIGAITHDASGETISDAIYGSASWCPVTSYDTADAAYEWMMGQHSTDGERADGTWTALLSADLASSYADFVNGCDLRDSDDNSLTLDSTSTGTYLDGTYYTHLVSEVTEAANAFFQSTQFPYTYTPQHITNPGFPGDPSTMSSASGGEVIDDVTSGAATQAATTTSSDTTDAASTDATSSSDASSSSSGTTTTTTDSSTSGLTQVQAVQFATVSDYVNALNSDANWIVYNQNRATVRITGLSQFVRTLKAPTKGVPAFDRPDRSSVANQLFGIDDESTLHFDSTAASLIAQHIDTYSTASNWDNKYVTEWGDDVAKSDSLTITMPQRVNMFNPLYFLSGSYDGYGTATVAPHWRINSGLFQTETSLCTETNLALALQHYDGVSDVAFTPVWGQGHVLAERSGSSTSNFIDWVVSSCS